MREEQKTGRRQGVKINLERKIGSLNSESNLVISLTTVPAEGQRGRGQVPGVHLPQQKYRHGAWLAGKLENLKWEARSQAVCCSLLLLFSVTEGTSLQYTGRWEVTLPAKSGRTKLQVCEDTRHDQDYRRVSMHAAFGGGGKTLQSSVFGEPLA